MEFFFDGLLDNKPLYFIAEIGSNFDGDLSRAKDLIWLAAEAGANAAKFQHYTAGSLVSDRGFRNLSNSSHQNDWQHSVFETYDKASLNYDWTNVLKLECDKANIDFMTSPYSFELVDYVADYVKAFKIGSGDIDWVEIIEHIAAKNKPVMLATGASNQEEVDNAYNAVVKHNGKVVIMQCNTNYTNSMEVFNHLNLNVLKTYSKRYPDAVLGLSDHSPGFTSVIVSIALGARVIEKHFTDDNNRIGPDHGFAITPKIWRDMVEQSTSALASLGSGNKKVEENEYDTRIVQRRCIRAKTNLTKNSILSRSDCDILRPCPSDGLSPSKLNDVIGKKLTKDIVRGDVVTLKDIDGLI